MSNIEDGMSRGGQVLWEGNLLTRLLDGEKVDVSCRYYSPANAAGYGVSRLGEDMWSLFSCQCGWVRRVKARGGLCCYLAKLPCNVRESKIEWEARRRGQVLLEKLSRTRHDPCCMCYIPNTVSSVPNSSHTSFPFPYEYGVLFPYVLRLNWKERQTFNLEVASSTLAVAGGLVRILGMVIFVQWWYGCFLPPRERSQITRLSATSQFQELTATFQHSKAAERLRDPSYAWCIIFTNFKQLNLMFWAAVADNRTATGR
ncbi:hypothetical protein DFH06DRAFT_1125843 [Mycena polygramma]|nr:hypothetical protein DFH06DRAFT_1125843 [Mycena polygramma]